MSEFFSFAPSPELAALWERLCTRAKDRAPAAAVFDSPEALKTFAELYLPIAAPDRTPFVIAQLGQSLDGYIATQSGDSHYVTGAQSRVHLHRLRALCDAVVVGWRTVAADDPQLTVRHVTGENPLRVVIDMKGRLPARHRVFSRTPPGVLRLVAPGTAPLDGVESVEIAAPGGRCDPEALIRMLAARGHSRILIEGGGETVSSFLLAGALDRLHLAIAPLIVGGGRRGIALPPVGALSEAMRPESRQIAMGRDVLFDLDVRTLRVP